VIAAISAAITTASVHQTATAGAGRLLNAVCYVSETLRA
jgi:hypothetical protein